MIQKEIESLEQMILSLQPEKFEAQRIEISNSLKKIDGLRKSETISETDFNEIFNKKILRHTNKSDFHRYIYDRPRGYPGDFFTQELIWNGRTRDKEIIQGNEFQKDLNITEFALNMEACEANEVRVKYLKELIKSYKGKRIASLACGSCIELWGADEEFKQETDIFLLDQEKDAIESARKNIGNHRDTISFHCEKIVKFLMSEKEEMGKRDLIYIFGLFDYFDLKSTKRIIQKVWDSLNVGGEIFLTNAHPDNPSKFWMEYIGNWFLDYKTKEDLLEIAGVLDNVKSLEYFIDDQNVYQYLRIKKSK